MSYKDNDAEKQRGKLSDFTSETVIHLTGMTLIAVGNFFY